MFYKLASGLLNLEVQRSSTVNVRTRNPSLTKKWRGVLKPPSATPSLVGSMLLETAEQEVPYWKAVTCMESFFLLRFYCSLFLMNGNLTFPLFERDCICFVALQTCFAPSPCPFFFTSIKNKQKTSSEKPMKPEQNKPNFLKQKCYLAKSWLWKLLCQT